VDASFHEDVKVGATGDVLCDSHRLFIASSSSFLPNVDSAVMAEPFAMKEGLDLAISMGCSRLIAESDSMEVVAAF
jgi:hypothetical protein